MKTRNILTMVALAGCVWFAGQGAPTPSIPPAAGMPAAGTPRLPLPAAAPAAPALAGPVLKIEDADPAAAKAVALESLEIAASLRGPLAQTTVTLTFRNTMSRQLEGELEFPLPEGAAVVGYGLDVPAGSGMLVPGVAIEKERARQIFESEERRRVDPGILEQTKGNNYRTRVHPIPAGGTRTVQITYVSDVVSDGKVGTYKLPLEFAGNLKSAKLHVEVLGNDKSQDVHIAGLSGLAFAAEGGGLVAEKTFSNIALSGSLVVSQPVKADDVYTAVEGYHFMVSAIVPAVAMNFEIPRIEQLTVVWDTSLSRVAGPGGADRTAEYEALRAILKATGAPYVVYGTDGKELKRGAAAEAEALITFLKGVPCDGALDLDGVQQVLQTQSMKQREQRARGTCLLFSDGLVTLGKGVFAPDNMTIYTVCGDAKADHAFLKRVADASGGVYLNLQRMKPADAVAAVTMPAMVAGFELASGDTTKITVQELYPAMPVRVVPGQRVAFAGELHANEVKGRVVVNVLGSVNGPAWTKEVTLTSAAKGSGIVPRYWAQQKVAALSVDAPKNEDAIVAVAKEFNLVTPRTSLLVLETADQYVRYHVAPPASRPEVLAEFNKRIEADGVAAKAAEAEKIEHILALWKGREEWWNTTFVVPTKEQLAQAAATQSSGGGQSQSSAALRRTFDSGGAVPGMTVAPAPQAPVGQEVIRQSIDTAEHLIPYADLMVYPDNWAQLKAGGQTGPVASIAIKGWTPDTPYLKAMNAGKAEEAYAAYLAQRKDYLASPAFYLDCGNWLLEHGQRDMGVRVLTNIAQLKLESAPLLRVAAYRLMQVGEYKLAIDLFERAKALRPDEPQSWRDLALAISTEARQRAWDQDRPNIAEYKRQMGDLMRAMDLYNHVVMNKWERFDEIELVSLMEANALWAQMQRMDGWRYADGEHTLKNPLDGRLVKNLDCDVRIVMTWDADDTDIDLHVIEPTGQEAFYGYNRTLAGGLVSRDFTQGYGPEEYLMHHAVPGTYKIAANYYGSSQQSLQGPVTVQATVITNFGRADEKRQSMTLRLTDQKETVAIGEVTIGK